MINVIVAIFGGLLFIAGFYFMYLGFSIPPNPLFFFLGLISAVLGMILVVLFGSSIDLSRGASKSFKAPARDKTSSKVVKPENLKAITTKKPPKKVATKKPAKNLAVKPAAKRHTPPIRPRTPNKADVKPRTASDAKSVPKTEAKIQPKTPAKPSDKAEPKFGPQIKSSDVVQPPEMKKITPLPKKDASEPAKPVKKSSDDIPQKVETPKAKPAIAEPVKADKESKGPLKPDLEKLKSKTDPELKDDNYVKNRLEWLKENYIVNTKDIESLVDERLDSFKGTLNRLKTETKDPSIIWSFDAQDVQGALKDTLSQAENRILMMYPWVRNIDVSILKKFMDTKSRMIIQEASLDDDASVELIKLLLENDVKIRTMPHVHTVAVVADDNNGLIISTDPIYESYEVGVIYRDQKSIEEIGKMFEDAWNLSKEMDLEIRR